MNPSPHWLAFVAQRCIAEGPPEVVVAQLKPLIDREPLQTYRVLDATSSQVLELDWRGTLSEVLARLPGAPAAIEPGASGEGPRGPGRPRLGVVAREVTLLPRHWDWLAAQPGGASVALRKVVEKALRENAQTDRQRLARESAYRFMFVMAGNAPGFEEASRALFADDLARLASLTAEWPADVHRHLMALARQAQPHETTARPEAGESLS